MEKRWVLVTGSSSGLGNAVIESLKENENFIIISVDINENTDENFIHCDLNEKEMVENLVVKTRELTNQSLYAIVNVAGISIGKTIEDMDEDDWQRMIQVNLTSPALIISGLQDIIQDGGRIVNVSSPVSITGSKKPGYAASKAGIHGLTMSVAKILGKRKILVNSVYPGPMITGMTRNWPVDKRNSIAKESFLQRLTTPDEVAKGIAFLLDPTVTGITGSILDFTAGSMYTH